jgi:hypothetical protein
LLSAGFGFGFGFGLIGLLKELVGWLVGWFGQCWGARPPANGDARARTPPHAPHFFVFYFRTNNQSPPD